MKKLFVFCFFAISIIFARADVSEPDFAYPQQVINNAEQQLKTAQKSGDGIASLQALMQISVAQNSINSDSMQYVARRVLNAANTQRNTQVQSLMHLYAATVINNIYQLNKSKYNRRQLPLTPRPADMTEWSGEMFTAVIDSLCSLAWRNVGDMPISELEKVVQANDLSSRYYPTQADFVASKIVSKFSNDTALCAQVKREMALKHTQYSAGWFTWQLQQNKSNDVSSLMDMYLNTPSEYRSNAALVLQYILKNYTANTYIDKYGADKFIADIEQIQPEQQGTWAENIVANILSKARKPYVKLSIPSLVVANQNFDVSFEQLRNLQAVTLDVLKDSKTKVATYKFPINHDSAAPADTVVQITLPVGSYSIQSYVTDDGSDSNTTNVQAITAYPIAISNDNGKAVHVIDPLTGKSLSGVTVSIIKNSKTVASAVTDKNGMANFKNTIAGYVSLEHSGVTQDFSTIYLRLRNQTTDVKYSSAVFTTDMPIYMPGDTVQWMGILSNSGKVVADRTVSMKVTSNYDGTCIAEMTATTDEFGAISGKFAIPESAMGASYCIGCTDNDISSSSTFVVSDFKPETMKIDNYVVWPLKVDSNSVVVSGTVTNYSGFGIDNATVECSLDSSTVQGVTDNNGNFAITVPYPAGLSDYAQLETRVTAADGSVITQTSGFDIDEPYTIKVSSVEQYYDTASPVTFEMSVVDPAKQNVEVPVLWSLLSYENQDVVVAQGEFNTNGKQTLDLSDIPAAKYVLKLKLRDSSLAQSQSDNITLYNSHKTLIPTDNCVWVDRNTIKVAPDGNSLSFLIGAAEDGTIAYTLVGQGTDCVSHTLKAGYQTVTLDITQIPDGENRFVIYALRDLKRYNHDFKINRESRDVLKFNTESFRDKIYSQTTEHWQMNVTDGKGNAVKSAMTLTVYDKRLNSFANSYRSLLYIPSTRTSYYIASTSMPWVNTLRRSLTKSVTSLDYNVVSLPEWIYQDSDFSFVTPNSIRIRSTQRYAASPLKMSANSSADAVEELSTALYASGSASDAADTEVAEISDDMAITTDEGGDDLANIALRNATDYLALWQPSLRSDDKGAYNIDFLVPNANTTWHLDGFAWTKDGKSVSFDHDFVAAKPIMVSVNAPQFVRGDDSAKIALSVMNNSDEVQNITIAAYVDADTLAVGAIEKQTYTRILQPGASEILNITLDATQAALQNAGVAYVAAKISNGTFSDGERVKVPVLPSQTQVINSTNFYLNPGDTDYSFDVPNAAGDNFTCSLTFTENPMWTIVEALPTLTAEENILPTANRQAAAYFSAAVALGLMKQHPELELQFDAANLNKILKSTQQKLIELQQTNGSWRWGRWCSIGDLYVTESVLSLFAMLKQSGYLPSDNKLEAALSSAVSYCDGAVSDTDMTYTIFRPIFSDVTQSLNGKKVSNATVQQINKNWKKYDVAYKAQAAVALYNTGNKNMAKTLIGSLDEFGTQTASKGFEFMNVRNLSAYAWLLQAYSSVVPTSEHVDGIRQYLIVRKQATNWGNYPTTSQIVSAMINSGTKWTESAEGATVTVDGTLLDVQSLGRMGTLTTELTGRHVSIATSGKTPAYGAIIAKYNAPMKDVQAFSDGEISIDKTIYVQRDGKWQTIDSLSVGEKVKIVLTVKASRPFSNLIITDDRAATFLPKVQTSGWVYGDGVSAYRENRTSATNLYINYMPKGTYLLEYEMSVNNAGQFASGLATVTCTQAPELTAHSAGSFLTVY